MMDPVWGWLSSIERSPRMNKPAPKDRDTAARSWPDRLAIIALCVGIALMTAGVAIGWAMYLTR